MPLDFSQGLRLGQAFKSGRTRNRLDALAQGEERQKALFEDVRNVKTRLQGGDTQGSINVLNERLNLIRSVNGDPSDTMQILRMIETGNVQGALSQLDVVEGIGVGAGFLSDTSGKKLDTDIKKARLAGLTSKSENGPVSAETRGFLSLLDEAKLTGQERMKAIRIKLRLAPGAVGSGDQTIAQEGTAQDIATSKAAIAGAVSKATESAKLEQQLKWKSLITTNVKLAEKSAIERGDVLNALERSQAALPGLKAAVDELKELALIATSTFGGKIWDGAVKQTGFGSTKGAGARAGFIAIVNNQVLPLLKETFGAAFTAQEGESLKATMGDPDSTPEEKLIQLNAFIAQKERDIGTKELQLSQPLTIGRFTVEAQ